MDDRPIPPITDDPISSKPTTDRWRVAPRVLATVGVIAASLLIIERLWFANPAPTETLWWRPSLRTLTLRCHATTNLGAIPEYGQASTG